MTGTLRILRHPEPVAVVRLGPGSDVPTWAASSSVFSIAATATETAVVCAASAVPTKSVHQLPLTAYAVDGAGEARAAGSLVTLLAGLDDPDAATGTAPDVRVVSTYDTDWVLVPAEDAERVEESWRRAGHELVTPPTSTSTSTKDRTR